MIDQAISALPVVWQAGHHDGDELDLVLKHLTVSADTAGGSKTVIEGLADRNVVFKGGLHTSEAAAAVIAGLGEHGWQPALRTDGTPRDGAQVREVDDLVPDWPPAGPGRSCVVNGPARGRSCRCGTTMGCATR